MSNDLVGTSVYTDVDSGALKVRQWQVRVLSGPHAGQQVLLQRGSLHVGSSRSNDLVLTDPRVSRAHLELRALENGLEVRDLGSRNGTFQGTTRIQESVLLGPSVIRLGDTELSVAPADEEVSVDAGADTLGNMVGSAPAMRHLFGLVQRIAPTDVTVLIEGETGTGKELVARELHRLSPRQAHPIVVVDCGALPAGLVESELFGHVKGAFTGAVADRDGAFAQANGGTLFLDEIGELPLELQPKLLRALEQRVFKRVGDGAQRSVDLRVVAATSRDLSEEVSAGRFRRDLFYRLAVVRLKIPPLRERLGDLPPLLQRLVTSVGAPQLAIPECAIERLAQHSWPGNVRELRNVVSHALALHPDAAIFELPGVLGTEEVDGAASAPIGKLEGDYREARAQALEDFEKRYLASLLARHSWNVSGAAREAGVDRNYLHRLIRRHDIQRP